ncbi:EAL domain-containing protein [Coleofasciculus sp. FACHB-1120]|uniref:sensor domain-containing protein n=1 Tax=Coleofasciculus sp. FACHB-1120 TaxID=2692783 RepID=UPI00168473AB|nr:EAL domain-containing protein [Coleofasciculus sp. FACHB-1120]MBD2743444.1 EAL domain-containing protein [Coleofasciculus sp. FACHB-1120]
MRCERIDNAKKGGCLSMSVSPQHCLSSLGLGNEQLLRASVGNAPIILYALDRNGIFTLSEGKGLEALGLKAGEAIGQSIFDLYKDQPDILANIRNVLAGKEATWITSLGNLVYENRTTPLKNETGEVVGLVGVAIDITERQKTDERLRQLAAAVEFAEDAIAITSTHLMFPGPEIVFVNRAFTRMTGYIPEEVIGKSPRILQGPKTDRRLLDRLRQTLSEGKVFYGEAINYRKDGTEFYNEWHIEPIKNEQDEITHYLAIQRDISQRKQVETQLFHAAYHDALTGLPNRAFFMERLRQTLERANQCQDYLFAVLFLDVDRFKVINDSLGHVAGDQLLVAIAKILQAAVRPEDTVARLSGDEFAIVLADLPDLSQVTRIANRLQRELRKPLQIEGQEVFSTVSIGIALSMLGYDQAEDILRDADIAMYRAKTLGRARYAVFNKTMHHQAVARLQMETDLRHVLERQELRLHYQPIVSLATGQISGFEALVRWQHPTRGLVSPEQFIPVAEETGLILPIGEWVLREACSQLQHWQSAFPNQRGLKMSVNLSGRQFLQPDLIEKIDQILRNTECDPYSLKLEITESAIADNEDAIAMLEYLRVLGIELSIDDFGTGYSSLSRLFHFPINTLKIDRSFISRMGIGGESLSIVRAIVTLANNLGMDVTAEGIETAQQMQQLRTMGCESGQGYLFSKPVDSMGAETLIAALSCYNLSAI